MSTWKSRTMRHPSTPGRVATRTAWITTAALGMSVLAASSASAGKDVDDAPDPDGINGYRSVGYFQAHAPSKDGRDYQVADIIESGAADHLTHINYSFGNVTTDLVCDITDELAPDDAVDPGQVDGDPLNDYQRLVSAADSVDGVADAEGQALAGNFNQLLKLKEEYPDLKILISLGGWTWSDNFSDASLTAESRERLVDSCLDIYIDGDLPVADGFGGEGVAAGVFDGIDIDWEWPAANGEHPSPNPDVDKENFLSLLEEFRAQLDERGEANDEDYLLTGFAPAGWSPRTNGGWVDPRAVATFDYLNIQGYDYHGTWVTNRTGHQGNLHAYEWPTDPTAPEGEQTTANWGLAADGLLNAYKAAGYAPEQINLGMAIYGQGWEGVENGDVPGAAATGAIGTKTYDELQNIGEEYYDEAAGAAWRYDGDQWWSLDTTTSVRAKSAWLAENDFGGAMWWDLSGDKDADLVTEVGNVFAGATPGPRVSETCAAPWYATTTYTRGDVVAVDGMEYEARWWVREFAPGGKAGHAWKQLGECGTSGTAPVVEECAPVWDDEARYKRKNTVSFAGVNHEARWWNSNEVPGVEPWGPWEASALCS
ncbi:glycosyl hydrolase family 18 protein [Demequina sediminicola]|uniref:glycosyl hydrolase family 18 protein n=1 Tax=Demequina sediminicola TaxID=1095026 RepID=UPI0009E515E9|nr:glycosyl hydrolase family 18 protein [Demequina sediminicola]